MKNNYFAILILSLLASVPFAACNGSGSKDPMEVIRKNIGNFALYSGSNQIDSLRIFYPGIPDGENIVAVDTAGMNIQSLGTGKYIVTFPSGITLNVTMLGDTAITVTESFGLITYPEDKMDIARKTGQWADSLNDVQLYSRMHDEGFQAFLKKRAINPSKILTVGSPVHENYGGSSCDGYTPIINNTDVQINGSDYSIIINDYYDDADHIHTEAGKTIPPKGRIKVPTGGGATWGLEVKGVKMKLTKEQIQERFNSYNGTEYQQYLNSK